MLYVPSSQGMIWQSSQYLSGFASTWAISRSNWDIHSGTYRTYLNFGASFNSFFLATALVTLQDKKNSAAQRPLIVPCTLLTVWCH